MTYTEPRLQRYLEAGFTAPQKFEHRALHELAVSRDDAALNVLSTMNLLLFERLHYIDIPLPLLVVLLQSGLSRHAIVLAIYFYGEQALQAKWTGNQLPEAFRPVKATRAELAAQLGMSKKQFDTGKQELILHDLLYVEPYRDGRQVEANLYFFYLPDELVEQIHKHAPRIARPPRRPVQPAAPASAPQPAAAAPAAPAPAATSDRVHRYGELSDRQAAAFRDTVARIRANSRRQPSVDKNVLHAESGDTPLPEKGEALMQTTVLGFSTNLHTVPQPTPVDNHPPEAARPAALVAKNDSLCRNARGDRGYTVAGLFVKAEKPLFRVVAGQLLTDIRQKGWSDWQGMQLLTLFEDSYRQADHATIHPLRLGRFLIRKAHEGKLNVPYGFGSRHLMSIDLSRGQRRAGH